MSPVSESKSKRKLVFSHEEMKKTSGPLWSEEDDISLLKGMIDYEVLKHSNPYDEMGKFLDFVKPCLHFNVQRKQLTDRLWKLKNKFLNSLYDISKPHHANLLELSKLIKAWGHHESLSLDGDKSENVVFSGDEKGEDVGVDNVVVGDGKVGKAEKISKSKEKGKLVTSDDRNGGKDDVGVEDDVYGDEKGEDVGVDNVVVGDDKVVKAEKISKSKEKGKLVTSDDRNGGEDDFRVKKCSEVVKKKKKRKLTTKDGQNVEEVNVVLDDVNVVKCSKEVKNKKKGNFVTSDGHVQADNEVVDDVDVNKSKKISKNKEKGKLVTGDAQNGEKDNVGIDDDVHVDKCAKVVKKKRKLVSKDGQNVEEVNVVLDDVNGRKCSKEVKKRKKGEVLTCDGQNDQDDAVIVGDGKSEQVVKVKNKENVVTCGDQNVEEDNVVVDLLEVDGSESAEVVKGRNRGEDVTTDVQDIEENHVVVHEVYGGKSDQVVKEYDVDGNKCSKLVKDKKMKKVVISDGQNVEEVNPVVDGQSAKKNGKKSVKVLGNENVPKEGNKKDLEDFTSMYPELTNALELETLSRMPQHIKKKCVMDTINFMGREKANEQEEKLVDFRLMEMKLNAKKLELTSKQINLILEAMRR